MASGENYSDRVLPVLRSTRDILLPYYGNLQNNLEVVGHKKGNNPVTVITELDLKVEKFLCENLKVEYPEIGFVGEEFDGDRNLEKFWLCDPIDGTAHFIRGLPFCTSMLALIEKGEVVFSAIYHFVTDQMYHAAKGQGAKMDGHAIKVSDRPLSQAYLGWESHIEKNENMKKFKQLDGQAILFDTVSSGYEHCLVASGKLEGRICFDPWGYDYDFASGALLVSEAGGIVHNIGKSTYNYSNLNFIAANPIVYKELTEGPDAIFPLT